MTDEIIADEKIKILVVNTPKIGGAHAHTTPSTDQPNPRQQ